MPFLRRYAIRVMAAIALIIGLYLTSLYSYLLFHSLVELFSIIVAFGVFMIAWNTRTQMDNTYLLLIGIALAFISIIDLAHTLTFKGMGVFIGYDANLPTQLWIAARYLQSITFLVAPLFIGRRLRIHWILIGYAALTFGLVGLVFGNLFPTCYIDGSGLTPFKIWSEYLFCAMLAGSILLLVFQRRHFDRGILNLLILSTIAMIASELAFTSYLSVYDLANFTGHIFKIIEFYLIYLAMVQTGLVKPVDLLFRNLREQEAALRTSQRRLHAFTEASPTLLYEIDAQGIIRFANRTLNNLPQDQFLGTSFTQWIPEEQNPGLAEYIKQDITAEDLQPFECTIPQSQKKLRTYWIETAPFKLEDGVRHAVLSATDITERKRAEEKLRESEERYRRTLDNMLEGCQIIGFDWRYLYLNDLAAAQGHRQREELLHHTMMEAYPDIEHSKLFAILESCMKDRAPTRIENEFVFPDGSSGWFELSIQPVPEGIFILSMDITERKRTEQALSESEERFRLAFENASTGMCLVDLKGHFLSVNRRLCEMLNYAPSELKTKSLYDVTHPLYRDRTPLFIPRSQVIENTLEEMEQQFIDRRGQVVWGRIASSLVRDAQGSPLYFISHIQDITAYKLAGDQLRQLSRAVEQSPASIVITNTNGIIEYVNPKFTQVTGYSFEEAVGQNPRILKSGELSQQTYAQLWNTIIAGQEWHGEFHNRKKNGELYWESASISPIADPSGKITHFVAVKEDISARKQTEKQLYYLSTHDMLTGLFNRAHFEAELARLERSRLFPASIIVADADNMKSVNDSLGHAAGDELLRRLARLMQAVFRVSDIIARIGGDEFAILLPETDADTAAQILARVHEKLIEHQEAHKDLPLSLSLGVATTENNHFLETFKLADERMYETKRARKQTVDPK